MSLFQEWVDLYEGQNDNTFRKFWEDYSEAEKTIYTHILKDHKTAMSGTVDELSEKLNVDKVLFAGFLDGINSSLNQKLDLENLSGDTKFTLDIDFEKLYFNMLDANAEHLYTISEWDNVLSEEKRAAITKEYKRSKTVVKGEKIGRNDPCPCGSGKKYKKCCGKAV